MKTKTKWAGLASMAVLVFACGDRGGSGGLPTSPPTQVQRVDADSLQDTSAVSMSPAGETIYALAADDSGQPAVVAVAVDGGGTRMLHAGAPLLYPSDLATSCDGSTVYIADMSIATELDELDDSVDDATAPGAVYALDVEGETLEPLTITGLGRAAGLAATTDCNGLVVTGFDESGQPAVFDVSLESGAAKVRHVGDPLRSPTGVHVDGEGIAWVNDHVAFGDNGEGVLFAIDREGATSEVISGLALGRHGGVSLTPGGVTAVIPVQDELTGSLLLTANTSTGEQSVIPIPEIGLPRGVAAATEAPVMAIAGSDSLFIATFD